MYYNKINLKKIQKSNVKELKKISSFIRNFLISSVSKTGGHIGANLATIELTVALHKFFKSPIDKIVFDTGHQGYTHKILTGRINKFSSLNKYNGLSRFIKRSESVHDTIDASHAGTALSIGSGLAFKFANTSKKVCVICGDGSFNEGMTFEALNFLADKKIPLTIVINDNEISIAKNIGAIKNLFVTNKNKKAKDFFTSMGFDYYFVKDGHNIEQIITALNKSRKSKKIPIIHVKTIKGKGLKISKKHKYKMHFSMPFDPKTGKGVSPTITGNTYGKLISIKLETLIKKNNKVFLITPATPYASYLDDLIDKYPSRVIDVGMAEQHAVGFASGLSLNKLKPIVCIQSTFLQRAYDQILHDLAYMNLPTTILSTRSGFSGYDSATHHGIHDISYLRSIPNLEIYYPLTIENTFNLIKKKLNKKKGPQIILQPYEQIEENVEQIVLSKDKTYSEEIIKILGNNKQKITIICLPNLLSKCIQMYKNNKFKFNLIVVQRIKPFPVSKFKKIIKKTKKIIVIEEGIISGGLGSIVAEVLNDHKINKKLLRIGINDQFIEAGNKNECSMEAGIAVRQLENRIIKFGYK